MKYVAMKRIVTKVIVLWKHVCCMYANTEEYDITLTRQPAAVSLCALRRLGSTHCSVQMAQLVGWGKLSMLFFLAMISIVAVSRPFIQ